MKRDDIDKLLGGYATGTLTAEEREALFAAALEDQQLFEALAGEEPLRELLQDPIVKGGCWRDWSERRRRGIADGSARRPGLFQRP